MSNLWLNIRVGLYHVQATKGWFFWWPSISRNDYHRGRTGPWFEVYAPFYLAIGGTGR